MKDNTNYILHENGSRRFLTFPMFDKYDGLKHLFTTRHGGVSGGYVSSWNLGAKELDTEENILRNFEILADTLGIRADEMVRTQQTHTTNIRVVTRDDAGKGVTRERGYTDIDGLVTDEKGLAIITTHADCNAVFFYDPVKRVIGLAHSGWRGTLGGISAEMIRIMKERYGSDPGDIVCGIGPALCMDCFEVDPDVAEAFISKDPAYREFMEERPLKFHIDLKRIIRHDLEMSGVSPQNISDMGLCTKCHKDVFYSHRGHHGKRGLMAAAMIMV